jgi:tRNA1Val (adenine37-N6)-methyltransferase
MDLIHELLGYDKIKIVQNLEMFRFSLDSMLLAAFVEPKRDCKRIIDLGCGNAPIPLFLTMKTKAQIYGVEIQKEVYDLAVKSVEINGFQNQIQILHADICNIYRQLGANIFDIVISNPPYFKWNESSNVNKNDYLTIARHEVKIDLEGIVKESKKLLTSSGHLYLVHRVERLSEVLLLLHTYDFGIRRLRFVYPKTESKTALLFLLEARNNRPADVRVEPPLYVYEGNEYTEEVRTIFNFKKNQNEI